MINHPTLHQRHINGRVDDVFRRHRHNIFTQKHLGPFTEDEARDCVVAYLANTSITFTEREIDRLLIESGSQPAELQSRAGALFEEKLS